MCECRTNLRAGTTDLTDVAVVDLGGFGWLFGSQLLVLEGRLLGECVSRPGRRRCHGSHRLLLLLLLLLVVAGGGRVNRRLVTRVRGTWTQKDLLRSYQPLSRAKMGRLQV